MCKRVSGECVWGGWRGLALCTACQRRYLLWWWCCCCCCCCWARDTHTRARAHTHTHAHHHCTLANAATLFVCALQAVRSQKAVVVLLVDLTDVSGTLMGKVRVAGLKTVLMD